MGAYTSSGRELRSEPHEPFAFCDFSRKATPRAMAASICFGSGRGTGLGLGPISANEGIAALTSWAVAVSSAARPTNVAVSNSAIIVLVAMSALGVA